MAGGLDARKFVAKLGADVVAELEHEVILQFDYDNCESVVAAPRARGS